MLFDSFHMHVDEVATHLSYQILHQARLPQGTWLQALLERQMIHIQFPELQGPSG